MSKIKLPTISLYDLSDDNIIVEEVVQNNGSTVKNISYKYDVDLVADLRLSVNWTSINCFVNGEKSFFTIKNESLCDKIKSLMHAVSDKRDFARIKFKPGVSKITLIPSRSSKLSEYEITKAFNMNQIKRYFPDFYKENRMQGKFILKPESYEFTQEDGSKVSYLILTIIEAELKHCGTRPEGSTISLTPIFADIKITV